MRKLKLSYYSLLFEHVEVISKPSLKKIKSHQSIDIHELIDVTENF